MYHNAQIVKLRHLVLVLLWLDYMWEQYLRTRQYQKIKATTSLSPELKNSVSKKYFEKIRNYTLQRKRFDFIKDLANILTSSAIISYNLLPKLWTHLEIYKLDAIYQNTLWYLIVTSSLTALNFPLTLYELFVVEANSLKRNPFLPFDRLKTFFWGQILLIFVSMFLVSVLQQEDQMVISLWAMLCSLVLIIGTIFPQTSPSRFRQLTIMTDCQLRKEIFELAQNLHFPLQEIYIEESFKKSISQSLYFYGRGKNKKLVIHDGLLWKEAGIGCNNDEILAMFALEYSKWYFNHNFKYLLAIEMNLVLSFIVFYLLYKTPLIYKIFGFGTEHPALPGVYVVLKYVMVLFSTILNYVFMKITRSLVKKDDEFVRRFGKGEALISALVLLETGTMTFPEYDQLYSKWHHDKPPLLQRIRAIEEKL